MRVTLWGSRGSIASAGPETIGYGGDTSCVEVEAADGTTVILDAGSGIRRLAPTSATRVDVLLSHLHMDHVQGLGFFAPLFEPEREVHIWGPPSTTHDLRTRLGRYLSPPLFPVRLRDVDADLHLHDVGRSPFHIGGLEVRAASVIHPGVTTGFRLDDGDATLAYIPDHEPALTPDVPHGGEWTSGTGLSDGVDMLIHDVQYTDEEYATRVGWGHSRIRDAVRVAKEAGVARLVTFHHDPAHDDHMLDVMTETCREQASDGFEVLAGKEDATWQL